MDVLTSKQWAINSMRKLRGEDIEDFGCEMSECFDAERAIEAINNLPEISTDVGEPTLTHNDVIEEDRADLFDNTVNSYLNGYKDGWKECSDSIQAKIREQIYLSNMTAERQ